MIITRTHDPVHQISLIGQKEQPLRVLVKASHRIDPYGIVQIFGYRGLLALLFGTAHNASWFMK